MISICVAWAEMAATKGGGETWPVSPPSPGRFPAVKRCWRPRAPPPGPGPTCGAPPSATSPAGSWPGSSPSRRRFVARVTSRSSTWPSPVRCRCCGPFRSRWPGGYDSRFVGVGPDEFRRVLNAAVSLTAAVAIFSYVFKLNIARGYVAVAMPSTAVLDLTMRYWLRKHLHKVRQRRPVPAPGGRGRPCAGHSRTDRPRCAAAATTACPWSAPAWPAPAARPQSGARSGASRCSAA